MCGFTFSCHLNSSKLRNDKHVHPLEGIFIIYMFDPQLLRRFLRILRILLHIENSGDRVGLVDHFMLCT